MNSIRIVVGAMRIVLSALLAIGCSEREHVNVYNKPVVEICNISYCGTFVATGSNSGLTASHVANTGSLYLNSGGFGIVDYTDLSDLSPAHVVFADVVFTDYYETNVPIIGLATYITRHGEFDIYIYTDNIFSGVEPIPGDSGSPVIQDDMVVGIVTHSIVGGGLFAKISK